MNVYKLEADSNHYQNFVLTNKNDWDKFMFGHFDGHSMKAEWSPLEVALLRDEKEDHRERPQSDFPNLGGVVPVFSAHAIDTLRDLLTANGEVLPLRYREGNYFVYNPTRVVDALDEARSEIEVFKSSGRVMRIVRYEFYPERLQGLTAFRLSQRPTLVYVTEKFVQRVKDAGLIGFDFVPIWSSEAVAA